MKLDYTPPGWDAPLSEVIADLRTSIETVRELADFMPLDPEGQLVRELDSIAARVTNLVDVISSAPEPPIATCRSCGRALADVYSEPCSACKP